MQVPTVISLLFFLFLSLHNGSFSVAANRKSLSAENPFEPRASLVRYWKKQVLNNQKTSPFLLSKASPLSAVDSAFFANLAAKKSLSTHLPAFCSSAKLYCFPEISTNLEKHTEDSNFASYLSKEFQNYGVSEPGGRDSFKKYSIGDNTPQDSFQRYSSNAAGHDDKFSTYATHANFIQENFKSYGKGAAGGKGEFISYANHGNVPNEKFTTYSDHSAGRAHEFVSYAERGTTGDPNGATFTSYGKNGVGVPSDFKKYGIDSNSIISEFNNYGETALSANDTFTSYSEKTTVPENHFTTYGRAGHYTSDTFNTYDQNVNTGSDTFQSYDTESTGGKVNFATYATKGFNQANEAFIGYGKKGTNPKIGFSTYGTSNITFKDYANKRAASFTKYNVSDATGSFVIKKGEPGKFFREAMLKEGNVMPMPDISDKMPKRSFLPRTILSKLPFSTPEISQVKEIFHAADNSSIETIILNAVKECEREPSVGETKRCVGSAEDMIDFATSVLGRNVALRTTENVNGVKKDILLGSITGINGGRVTKSVSCHQSLYPYLLYYCHSVPKVRVYEADILDVNSKAKINRGVAICHLDTSSWSPTHGAFMALGAGPGKIEVCHWIFENDLTWTISDS